MQELNARQVIADWATHDNMYYPRILDLRCPYCREKATFTTHDEVFDRSRATLAVSARCANCRNTAHVWLINPSTTGGQPYPGLLTMHPSPATDRKPIEGIDLLPEHIQRAYRDTVTVYNTGVWSATATLCRRTLEGIVSELEPNESGPLFGKLEKLSQSVNLAEPLITLSHAIRKVGNLGAHFDLRKEPDSDTVQAQLELIEYLLEYVYTLPGQINALNEKVETLGKEAEEEDPKSNHL